MTVYRVNIYSKNPFEKPNLNIDLQNFGKSCEKLNQ